MLRCTVEAYERFALEAETGCAWLLIVETADSDASMAIHSYGIVRRLGSCGDLRALISCSTGYTCEVASVLYWNASEFAKDEITYDLQIRIPLF